MDCPVCKNAMITFELAEVEVDSCLDCGGIWLDAGELEMLLEDEQQAKELLESFQPAPKTKEKARKCPICLKKMQKILVGQEGAPVMIDQCRRQHGLWFDKGELEDVLGKGSLDKGNKIRELLADMFGGEKQEAGAPSE